MPDVGSSETELRRPTCYFVQVITEPARHERGIPSGFPEGVFIVPAGRFSTLPKAGFCAALSFLPIRAVPAIIPPEPMQTVRNHPVYKQNYGNGWGHLRPFFVSPTGDERSPHLSGTVGLLLICRPQLASASLRPPNQNQLRYYSLKCAGQFLRSGFLPGRGIARSEAFPALQGQ